MRSRDYGDIAAGAVLISFGLFVAFYAASHYALGTVSRVGPAVFPTALGYLLAGLGALIALRAFLRTGELPRVEWRPLLTILAGITAFSLTAGTFGMIPAIVLLTILSALAEEQPRVIGTFVLAVILSLAATLIFNIALGVPLRLFNWPL